MYKSQFYQTQRFPTQKHNQGPLLPNYKPEPWPFPEYLPFPEIKPKPLPLPDWFPIPDYKPLPPDIPVWFPKPDSTVILTQK